MKLNSHNEWDTLKEVIVGTVDGGACVAFSTSEPVSAEKMAKVEALACEAYPEWLVDEANEDLEGLGAVMKQYGTTVLRPDPSIAGKTYSTLEWSAAGDRLYNMRDLHLVVGNTVLESPSQDRHRYFEAMGLYPIWYRYFADGCRWIAGPKPMLFGDYMINFVEDGQKHQKLTENEILFEAANAVRMGKDILYLVSRSGNRLGAKWMQSVLGDEYRIHTTDEIYRSSHIDSTVMCLRPGLVLLNAMRVNERNCPPIFDKWEKIYFSEIEPTPASTLEFHNTVRKKVHAQLAELMIETDIDHMASDWIGMNFLSLDPSTVIVDERQSGLIRILEARKFTVIPISFRHSHLLKGGIHCSTLDTVRESSLENYFD